MKLIIIKDFPLTEKKKLKASPFVVELHDDVAIKALAGGYAKRYPFTEPETATMKTITKNKKEKQ